MATENPFVKLFSIDFKDHVEVKKSGNTELYGNNKCQSGKQVDGLFGRKIVEFLKKI